MSQHRTESPSSTSSQTACFGEPHHSEWTVLADFVLLSFGVEVSHEVYLTRELPFPSRNFHTVALVAFHLTSKNETFSALR